MRFEQLQSLVEVANTGSITAAAKRLFISQQAVSANIKQLEEELGCTLLVREKNGVSLTAQGQGTLTFARKVLSDKEALCNSLRHIEQKEDLLVRICSNSSVANIVLPDVIDQIETKQQHCSLKITLEDNLENLFERVKTHQCDIGLLTFNAEELSERFATYQTELSLTLLVIDELVGVMNKKFLHREDMQISKEEFYSCRQSLYNIIPANKHLASAQTESVVWSNDADFHRAMLERNNTLVLMPSLAYQYFFSNKKYIIVSIEGIEVPLIHAAVYRKDAPAYIQDFINRVRLEMHMK